MATSSAIFSLQGEEWGGGERCERWRWRGSERAAAKFGARGGEVELRVARSGHRPVELPPGGRTKKIKRCSTTALIQEGCGVRNGLPALQGAQRQVNAATSPGCDSPHAKPLMSPLSAKVCLEFTQLKGEELTWINAGALAPAQDHR